MQDLQPIQLQSDRDAALPSWTVCEQARLSRDPRFDGLFFTAVITTGIYCRPICPAPPPKAHNVRYFAHAAAAESAGFRPCLRCRPELSPAHGTWRRGDTALARALALIDDGFLTEQPLSALAERVHIGERQLRRLFADRLGAPPLRVHATRRLLFAKQLLTETALPVTDVALAAGFGSVRRFNAAFSETYRLAPTALRKSEAAPLSAESLTLRLAYRPPYDWAAMLQFLRGHLLPGVEIADARGYARTIGRAGRPGWLRVSPWPDGSPALKLELHNVAPADLLDTVSRARRMLDLDADPKAIAAALEVVPRLRPLLAKWPGLRIPSGWDGFETAVRAIVGQQISVVAAGTMVGRIARHYGSVAPQTLAPGLSVLFPAPEQLADADPAALGLIRARAEAVRHMARALLEGRVDFRRDRPLDEFAARWIALPGVGPWTVQYLALRALGHPDAFPAHDLVLQRAASADGSRLTARELAAWAESCRPWRGYAAIHLWRDATSNSIKVTP